jgi:thioredoxin-like negative regulator of GroEL
VEHTIVENRMTFTRAILVWLVLTGTVRAAEAAEGILWFKDLKKASEVAQKNNRPMFVDFWADWCAVCKVMDADVYTDPNVIKAFGDKVVGVRLHFDLQPDMARKFNVPALPFLVWTTSYGTPLAYHRGLLEAEELGMILDAMPDLAEINRLDRNLQRDKNSFVDLVAMGRALRASGFYETSTTYLDRALKHKAAKGDAALTESIAFDLALSSLDLEEREKAVAALEKHLKAYPKSSRMADVLVALGRAYLLDERTAQARQSFNAVIKSYPESSAAAEAEAALKSF